jgi:UDP-N-acetylmuramate--alanine ligase
VTATAAYLMHYNSTLNERVHIIGAGGVGMSGLALLLQRLGADVSASDQNDTSYLRKLAQAGINTWVGSAPERIAPDAKVYYSSGIGANDSERMHAAKHNPSCQPRHALLPSLTSQFYTIAIAGCHGKTTTSAWVTDLLIRAGFDPSALVGGTVSAWKSNYREGAGTLGGKPLLVMEADESDRSFLSIVATGALVTNVDLDHTDIHESLESLQAEFSEFCSTAKATGGWTLASRECAPEIIGQLSEADRNTWESIEIVENTSCVVIAGNSFQVGLPGLHNLYNASLVAQVGVKLGLNSEHIAESLRHFNGVERRMQTLETFPQFNLSVIDDYAHHPHEIEATLRTLSGRYARLLIFWEPHRLSRFAHFHTEFDRILKNFKDRNSIFVFPIYRSSDKIEDFPDINASFRKFQLVPYAFIEGPENYDLDALGLDGQPTAAIFMGAGSSSIYAHKFVDLLKLARP